MHTSLIAASPLSALAGGSVGQRPAGMAIAQVAAAGSHPVTLAPEDPLASAGINRATGAPPLE